ncbi:MAG TPA: Gfo/Idh/MocA family oxidoreductase [Pyrinomonadaceae bacterium]|nr:Gfo/Idh/MocA family oxidoreductase [Pyrinomonadaceae bacterium]
MQLLECGLVGGHVYRLGACGAGSIFRTYEKAAADLGTIEFVAVADPSVAQLQRAARPGRFLTTDIQELLKVQLDAVLILSPNSLHARQALLAMERGLPVLCEKPLATNLEDARQLLAFAEYHQRHLQVAMHCRYRPEVEYLFEHLDGPITSFDQKYLENWMSASEWFFDRHLSGGGVLLDVGINQLDWLLPLVPGLVPLKVTYDMGERQVEVECELDCTWSNGHGRTRLSWRTKEEQKMTTVVTEPGTHFELDHQTHSVRVNGEDKGCWPCVEYEQVLTVFLSQLKEQPTVDRRAFRILEFLSQSYKLAGLPFLNDAQAHLSTGSKLRETI